MGKQSKSKHRDARTPPARPSPRTVPLHLPPKYERDARAQLSYTHVPWYRACERVRLCVVVGAECVRVVAVRVVALGHEAFLGLVRAARGGVETELVAVLALLLELDHVAADDDDDV